jgi:hypothetical protein
VKVEFQDRSLFEQLVEGLIGPDPQRTEIETADRLGINQDRFHEQV